MCFKGGWVNADSALLLDTNDPNAGWNIHSWVWIISNTSWINWNCDKGETKLLQVAWIHSNKEQLKRLFDWGW